MHRRVSSRCGFAVEGQSENRNRYCFILCHTTNNNNNIISCAENCMPNSSFLIDLYRVRFTSFAIVIIFAINKSTYGKREKSAI